MRLPDLRFGLLERVRSGHLATFSPFTCGIGAETRINRGFDLLR